MRILIVDDEPTDRLIIQTTLENLGHECLAAVDGSRAWDAFCAHRPDVVVSDWMMPGLTGPELCRNIRADAGSYVYFIMMTARTASEDVLEGMTAGADDYLLKPLHLGDLDLRLVAAARVTALHRRLDDQRSELEGLNLELTATARRDPLTHLANRRALQEDLRQLQARMARYGHRCCMALIDIDYFKGYNDTYGHLAGDQALRAVAAKFKRQTRGSDGVYRYGGDEFVCLFPEQSLATGAVAVHRMCLGIEHLDIAHTGSSFGILTVSAGLALLDPRHTRSVSDVLRDADSALYRAKELGRNRVEYAAPPHQAGTDRVSLTPRHPDTARVRSR